MKISSYTVMKDAADHYRLMPTTQMGEFVYQHPNGTTEGVSLILLLNEVPRLVEALEKSEATLRNIGRILYE